MPTTRKALTIRQKQVYDFIKEYQEKHMMSPSAAKIAGALGCTRSNIYMHIERLAKKGYIQRTEQGGIEKITGEEPPLQQEKITKRPETYESFPPSIL